MRSLEWVGTRPKLCVWGKKGSDTSRSALYTKKAMFYVLLQSRLWLECSCPPYSIFGNSAAFQITHAKWELGQGLSYGYYEYGLRKRSRDIKVSLGYGKGYVLWITESTVAALHTPYLEERHVHVIAQATFLMSRSTLLVYMTKPLSPPATCRLAGIGLAW